MFDQLTRSLAPSALLLGMLGCAGPTPPDAEQLDGPAACPPEDCATGYLEGDCLPDFSERDADGEEVALCDFSGDVVLVASEAMW